MLSTSILACLAWAVEATAGAYECPCITNASIQYPAIQAALVGAGRSKLYGLEGCSAYDQNNSAEGCASNEQSHCLSAWCYVDAEICPIDKDACVAAGGIVGSDTSPHCRARGSQVTKMLGDKWEYSYETCGSINTYDTSMVQKPLAGNSIKMAVDVWAPWVVKKPTPSGKTKYGGPLYDFFAIALDTFRPKVEIHNVGWSTPASRALFSSSYTACVHDVAVGNFDICVGALWMTSERARMSQFTPAVKHDYFYLLAPKVYKEDTLSSRLAKPFAPFTPAAWCLVVGFLLAMALVVSLQKLCDGARDAFATGWKNGAKFVVSQTSHAFFDVHTNFLQGSVPQTAPENTAANHVFQFAFAFFVLVILASYTASLASLLVVDRVASGSIASIDDAIDKGVQICVPEVIMSVMQGLHPRADFVSTQYARHAARAMHAGRCKVAITTREAIDFMHAGLTQEDDCKQVSNGDLTEAEGRCQNGFNGKSRNDCDLMRVGEILFTIPVAFPVSKRLQHSLSWAFTEAQAAGTWAETMNLNAAILPKSECKAAEKSEEDGLGVEDLSGTMMISFAVIVMGMIILVFELHCLSRFRRRKLGSIGRRTMSGEIDAKKIDGDELESCKSSEKSPISHRASGTCLQFAPEMSGSMHFADIPSELNPTLIGRRTVSGGIDSKKTDGDEVVSRKSSASNIC